MSKSWRKWSFFYSAYKLAFSFGLGVIRGQVGVEVEIEIEDCVLGEGPYRFALGTDRSMQG